MKSVALPTISSSSSGRTSMFSSRTAVDFWPFLPSQILGDSIPFALASALNVAYDV